MLLSIAFIAVAADPLYITLSSEAATEMVAAIERGDLAATAEKVGEGAGIEAWRVDGIEAADLATLFHETFRRCGGFFAHASEAAARAALSQRPSLFADTVGRYTIANQALVTPRLEQVQASAIRATIEHLSSYQNRYYKSQTGADAALWIRDTWKSLSDRTDVRVELFTHSFVQPSVIMTVPGDTNPEEMIVIGAHLDSINTGSGDRTTARAPGADDDASGIASMTEAMRVMFASGFRPKRTLKFIGYAGEEAGLLGSNEIAKSFYRENINVVGVLQLDMTNYQDGGREQIALISDRTDDDQDVFLGALIDMYLKVPWGVRACGYACSDHASWTQFGYAASFPFETQELNPSIHTANDTLARSVDDATHAAKFSRLALAYIIELSTEGVVPGPPKPPPPPSNCLFSDWSSALTALSAIAFVSLPRRRRR